jgi:hypothetical protein
MSYKLIEFNTAGSYACYESANISLATISTNYLLFTLPQDSTKKFYPEKAFIYYVNKTNSSDSITISAGWISTGYNDWVTTSNTVGGSFYSTGYHQNLTMVGDTYSTPPYRRYAAVGGTPIYLRTGASKTGSTITIVFSLTGFWTGNTTDGLP